MCPTSLSYMIRSEKAPLEQGHGGCQCPSGGHSPWGVQDPSQFAVSLGEKVK